MKMKLKKKKKKGCTEVPQLNNLACGLVASNLYSACVKEGAVTLSHFSTKWRRWQAGRRILMSISWCPGTQRNPSPNIRQSPVAMGWPKPPLVFFFLCFSNKKNLIR
jgi:hypothetical protein